MSSTITVRVDDRIKKEASNIFKEVGMDMTTAINVYLKQVIRSNGIPFPITADVPNAVTVKAIQEAERGEMASFSSIEALMEDLND
jgi:DNA-damage-inducible protein J